MIETQKSILDEQNQSGKWKTLYSKAVQDLSNTEKKILKHTISSAKLSQSSCEQSAVSQTHVTKILSDLNNNRDKLSEEQVFLHKQTLKSIVQDLQNQNMNLKHKLERLQASNAKGLEKLKYYYNENNKLKTELKLMGTRKDKDTSEHVKAHYELNTEIKNLNTKLKFEQAQRDELKRRYDCELGAAKIRYENELSKQNRIMLSKNQTLEQEINRLNESIKKLLEDKINLLAKMKTNKPEDPSEISAPSQKSSIKDTASQSMTNSKVTGKKTELISYLFKDW